MINKYNDEFIDLIVGKFKEHAVTKEFILEALESSEIFFFDNKSCSSLEEARSNFYMTNDIKEEAKAKSQMLFFLEKVEETKAKAKRILDIYGVLSDNDNTEKIFCIQKMAETLKIEGT